MLTDSFSASVFGRPSLLASQFRHAGPAESVFWRAASRTNSCSPKIVEKRDCAVRSENMMGSSALTIAALKMARRSRAGPMTVPALRYLARVRFTD